MKILELKLKKDMLIVDAEGLEITQALIFNKFGNYNLSCYDFICKGSDLTEEIASEFMSDFDAFNQFTLNYEYLKNLIYMIANKGFYWLENPIEKPINYDLWAKYGDFTQYGKILTEKCLKWQEAEEKTFKNPLIFVKK